ncbi:hypothetical protein [Flavobacterium selenitireducens]|uniref:hypothetical protein n=1 Tax=Flavobacterium selenitireducens TaxID=2722704 RepID=UPI00168AE4E7|nr:hypothetical protein [Flavobacterium selenitireducens]MBD3582404.1 hypothetical protein [Flavobacterium selenitireducens]
MKVKHIETNPVGANFVQVTVSWAARYAKKADTEIAFDIHYVLNMAGENPKIMMYISEVDQEALMRQNGLL